MKDELKKKLKDGNLDIDKIKALFGNEKRQHYGDLEGLSHVGNAVRRELKTKHWPPAMPWNITHATKIYDMSQTPSQEWWGKEDVDPGHSDSFPTLMKEIIVSTENWLDVASLAPPDGKFLDAFVQAIKELAEKSMASPHRIKVRLLFGNIIGMPVNCAQLIRTLTQDLPEGNKLDVWVGAWRRGITWNHAKIIAVDSKHLFTGGHNLWDAHYLQADPVHDVSFRLEGPVTLDGHLFCDRMWKFINLTDRSSFLLGCLPDWLPSPMAQDRANCAHYPLKIDKYPPLYSLVNNLVVKMTEKTPKAAREEGFCPIISVGRYGALHLFKLTANPSDTAINAMLASAQTVIRMSLQDFGPLTLPIPGMLRSIPGGVWPDAYMKTLAAAIYDRGVDVEVVLSQPHAVPGGLSPYTANYGNGWSCSEVASELIKRIKEIRPDANDAQLRHMVRDNLRITFLRADKNQKVWPKSQAAIGNHAKFFMVDDIAYYLGSQNLYIANLAEWGLIVDDVEETAKMKTNYWDFVWQNSFDENNRLVDVDEVMNGLNIERDGDNKKVCTEEHLKLALKAMTANVPRGFDHHNDEEHEITNFRK